MASLGAVTHYRKRTRSNSEYPPPLNENSSSTKVLTEFQCDHALEETRSSVIRSKKAKSMDQTAAACNLKMLRSYKEIPSIPSDPVTQGKIFFSLPSDTSMIFHIPQIMFQIYQYLVPQDIAQVQATSKSLCTTVETYVQVQLKQSFSCLKLGTFVDRQSVNRIIKPKTSILSLFNRCAFLLHLQNCTHPSPRCIEDIQNPARLGEQYITDHMRAILVDWMIEVSVEYRLSTTIIHSSVNLLDRCLSRIPIPRRQLQLLGCVCLMLESQRPPSPFEYSMKTSDVVYICDSQYDEQQVEQMRKVVVTSTFHKRIRTPPTTFCFLCQFLSMIHQPGFHREALAEPRNGIEHIVLSIFLSDLSLLDYGMLNFVPSTIALAILFLSRAMVTHFSARGLLISPFAVIEPKNREVRRLVGECHEFLPKNAFNNTLPFGSLIFKQFLDSAPPESDAVKICVKRLWKLHNDYICFLNFNERLEERPTFEILSQHAHMLKGLQEKYAPAGSIRAGAWMKLGALPEENLTQALSECFDAGPFC